MLIWSEKIVGRFSGPQFFVQKNRKKLQKTDGESEVKMKIKYFGLK